MHRNADLIPITLEGSSSVIYDQISVAGQFNT
jgi:hypothetical protein